MGRSGSVCLVMVDPPTQLYSNTHEMRTMLLTMRWIVFSLARDEICGNCTSTEKGVLTYLTFLVATSTSHCHQLDVTARNGHSATAASKSPDDVCREAFVFKDLNTMLVIKVCSGICPTLL
jgi:hypothetical protein